MIRTAALYLYTLGLILPPAAVLGGLLMLLIARRAEARPFSKTRRAA